MYKRGLIIALISAVLLVPALAFARTVMIPWGGAGQTAIDLPFNKYQREEVDGYVRHIWLTQTTQSTQPYVVVDVADWEMLSSWKVVLGPVDYLAHYGLGVTPGNFIKLIGSRVSMHGDRYLVATEVGQGVSILKLRTMSGRPLFPLYAPGKQSF